jgi:hypothetical protein
VFVRANPKNSLRTSILSLLPFISSFTFHSIADLLLTILPSAPRHQPFQTEGVYSFLFLCSSVSHYLTLSLGCFFPLLFSLLRFQERSPHPSCIL